MDTILKYGLYAGMVGLGLSLLMYSTAHDTSGVQKDQLSKPANPWDRTTKKLAVGSGALIAICGVGRAFVK